MKHEFEIECPRCRNISLMQTTDGSSKELAEHVTYLENKLYKLAEENKDLRQIIMKIGGRENE